MSLKPIKILYVLFVFLLIGCKANPDHLKFETNYLNALDLSAKTNKPIFVNFTGHTLGYDVFFNDFCTSHQIQDLLNEEYITLLLYTDDVNGLNALDTIGLGAHFKYLKGQEILKKANTVGQVNLSIEVGRFNANFQPYYLVLNSDEELLIEPFGYTRDRDFFINQLKKGLEVHRLVRELK